MFGVDDGSNKWILLDSCNIGKNIGVIESLDESIVKLEIDNQLPGESSQFRFFFSLLHSEITLLFEEKKVDSIARIVCSNRNTNEVFLSM